MRCSAARGPSASKPNGRTTIPKRLLLMAVGNGTSPTAKLQTGPIAGARNQRDGRLQVGTVGRGAQRDLVAEQAPELCAGAMPVVALDASS